MFVVTITDFGEVTGGADKVAITTARGLADHGSKVLFISATGQWDKLLTHENITLKTLALEDVWSIKNPARAVVVGLWNRKAALEVSKLLRPLDRRNTIVHIHSWTKVLSPSVVDVVSRLSFAWVVTFHDYFFVCPNGAYFNYCRALPCTLHPMSLSCMVTNCDAHSYTHKVVRLARHGLLRRSLYAAGKPLNVIHVSEFARDTSERFLPKGARSFLVTNPSPSLKSTRAAVADNTEFVYVGRFQREKGCILFARAAQLLRVRAIFLGAGDEADAISRTCPSAEIIHWGPKETVDEVLSRARALVFPSVWYETSGLIVLEALAKGVPVIASDKTGAAEFIEHGVNGFLFTSNDEMDLMKCMAQLQEARLAEQMGMAAFEAYWRKPPSLEAYVNALVEVYDRIIWEHSKRCDLSAGIWPRDT